MITIYSEKHRLRNAKTELFGGILVNPFENPTRADVILKRVEREKLGDIIEPKEFSMESVFAVHDKKYVGFLEMAWEEWIKTKNKGEMIPSCWPARRMSMKIPDNIEGKAGYYSMASETSISSGTWEAAVISKNVALTGAEFLLNEKKKGIFSLCRPPGHHAAIDMYGGYCFLNNAAIAAQWLIENGVKSVSILDIDFHHGNGTQDIFYEREDVLYLSIHGDPMNAFPYFSGYIEETGKYAGFGKTYNFPMPPGTKFESWSQKLDTCLEKINEFETEVLIVSLGVDTFEKDPISFFKLKSDDYFEIGKLISNLSIPTLFVMEGGYDIEELGLNVVNVLQAFES